MKRNSIQKMIDGLTPKPRTGALPKITPCPYCGMHMSQSAHAAHHPNCRRDFRHAPPQPAELDQDAGGGYNRDRSLPQT